MLNFHSGHDFISMRNKAMLALFFDTGMRLTEVMTMKDEQIRDGHVVVWGKGSKERVVPCSPYLARMLMKYRIARDNYFEIDCYTKQLRYFQEYLEQNHAVTYLEQVKKAHIGNPLLVCEHCKIISRNPMLDEWYNYSHKTSVILLPVLIPVLMGVLMPILMKFMAHSDMDVSVTALIGFVFGLIVSLCLSISNLIAIIKSKKRMRDPQHLTKLRIMNIISEREYQELSAKIQEK